MSDTVVAQDFPGSIAAVSFDAAVDADVNFVGFEDDMVILIKNDHVGLNRTATFSPVGTVGPEELGGEIEPDDLAVTCAFGGIVTEIRPSKAVYADASGVMNCGISAPVSISYALVRIAGNAGKWFHPTGLYDKHIYDQV
jgi:hypothetical protein